MATLMLLRRESPKLVAAQLGHVNETLVLRTYGHVIPGQDQEAADRLAETLTAARDDPASAGRLDVVKQSAR
jgi:integrase